MRFSWTITFIVVGFLLGAAIPSSAQEKLTVAMLQSPTQAIAERAPPLLSAL